MDTYEEHFEYSCKLRNEFWEAIGELEQGNATLSSLNRPSVI